MKRRTRFALAMTLVPVPFASCAPQVAAPRAREVVGSSPSTVTPTDAPGQDPTTTIPEPEAPLVTLPPGPGPTTTEPVEQSGGTPFPASSPSRTPAAGPASSTSDQWYRANTGSLPPAYVYLCESGGIVDNRRNPLHRGKWQFSFGTWRGVGGSGDPADASEAEQDYRASLLWDDGDGSGNWSCF